MEAEKAYAEAEEAFARLGLAMKYPTITAKESPNAVLRTRLGFSVIHRPVRTIPGVRTRYAGAVDLHVVRVGVGGTYEDPGRRVGSDAAVSIRLIERRPCADAARFAFGLARDLGCDVVSSSKYTIQRETDGLFEAVVDEVARGFPGVGHRRELFDSLLAKIVMRPEDFRVVVTPNEYGDFLSDAACGLVGSIGLGASASYAFAEDGSVRGAMFDPAGGTAPDIAGKGVANPTAALLALEMLLAHAGRRDVAEALGRAVRATIASGRTTPDLGGTLSTDAFADAVIEGI